MDQLRPLEVIHPDGVGEDECCMTFVLNGEDHTLGNSLRYMVMKNPDTAFCGYNIPHPSENKINFRIQTNGANAKEIFRKGLVNLQDVCQHILDTFEDTVEIFKVSGINQDNDEDDHSDESLAEEQLESDESMDDDSA
ncbi:DNA-directed RNA polymerases I and III subunit RPAC2-like [Rhopilema esculentum]|uniref:DNA-directed RNA polymerases I and III subunit RPAC2-like n=1 Tax=Rhopilema esculentum TaxID=499914 RepID=UPI0031DF1C51|eukprot:gene586-10277_t